jgi:hypothetical protein
MTRSLRVLTLSVACAGCGTSASSSAPDGFFGSVVPETHADACATVTEPLMTDLQLFQSVQGNLSAAMDLVVTDTDLYVALNGTMSSGIFRIHFSDSVFAAPMVDPVSSVNGQENAMAVTGGLLVFSESREGQVVNAGSGDIVRASLDGSQVVNLATDAIIPTTVFGPAGTLAVDDTHAYFAAAAGVKSVSLSGGDATTLTTHTGAIALIHGDVVVADSAAGAIYSVPAAGGDVTLLASGLQGNLGPIIACGSQICFMSEVELPPPQVGVATLQALDARGRLTPIITSSDLYVPQKLAFDGQSFYVTVGGGASLGSLVTIPLAANRPLEVTEAAWGLAVDEACVYVADTSGVATIAKNVLQSSANLVTADGSF